MDKESFQNLVKQGRSLYDNLFFDIQKLEYKVFVLEKMLLKEENVKREYYKTIRSYLRDFYKNKKDKLPLDVLEILFEQDDETPFL